MRIFKILLFYNILNGFDVLCTQPENVFYDFMLFNKLTSKLHLVIDNYQHFPEENSFRVVADTDTNIRFTSKSVVFQLFKRLGWNGRTFVYLHDKLGTCEIFMRDKRMSFENIKAVVDDFLFSIKESLQKKVFSPSEIEQIPYSFFMNFQIDYPLERISNPLDIHNQRIVSISEAYVGSLTLLFPYLEPGFFKLLLKDRLDRIKDLCIQRTERCKFIEEIQNLHGLCASLFVPLNALSVRLHEKSVSAPLIEPNLLDHAHSSESRNSVVECFRGIQLILEKRFKEVDQETYDILIEEWKTKLGNIIKTGSQDELRKFIFATCFTHVSLLDTTDGITTLFIHPNIFDELNVEEHIFPDHIEPGHGASYFEMKDTITDEDSSKAIEAVRYIRNLVLDPDVKIRLQASRKEKYPNSFEVLLKIDNSILQRQECPIKSLQEKNKKKFRSVDTALFTLDPLLGRYSINYSIYPCAKKLFDECHELNEESINQSLLNLLLKKITNPEAQSEIQKFQCLANISVSDIGWIINNTRKIIMDSSPTSFETFLNSSTPFAIHILDKNRRLFIDFKNKMIESNVLGQSENKLSIK